MFILLLGMGFSVAIDPYILQRKKWILLVIAGLCLCLVIQNYFENELSIGPARPLLRTTVAILGYIVRPIILVLFLHLVMPDKKHMLGWILVGLNAAVYLTALFSPVAFMISADNHYLSGPLADTALYISLILLIYLFIQSIWRFHTGKKLETWIPVIVGVMIIAGICLDAQIYSEEQPVSYLTMAITIGSMFYYIWIHMQLVRVHEQETQESQRIRIMATQIQPHFLFNTIATIKALCKKDPEKASEVAGKFGLYLRQNMNSLDIEGLIPFRKELEHTQAYADIEMVRFDNLRVEYDIEDDNFAIPPLTVQPMVENSIRHGVRAREAGIVFVQTFCELENHVIVIRDNGIGFDPAAAEAAEGEHIGIRNVRERIKKMCGGSLTIESRKEEGTTVIIRIPKKEGVS